MLSSSASTKVVLIWGYFMVTGYGLDDRGSEVRLPAGAGNFSLLRRVQTDSGAQPASYPKSTRGKAAVA